MTNERYKELMAQVGMPNSRSLLTALQQAANETQQKEYKKAVLEEREALKELLEDCKELFDNVIVGDPQCKLRVRLEEAIRARGK